MQKIFKENQKILLVAIGLTWLMLWLFPWGNLFTSNTSLYATFFADMIRLAIAIGLFIFPGALLYILLVGEEDVFSDLLGIIPVGFAFSVMLTSVIGLFGKVLGLSFLAVKNTYALFGLIELGLLVFARRNVKLDVSKKRILASMQNLLGNVPLLVAVIFSAMLMFGWQLFFIDDTTYLAYLTNWQHATHLSFTNIVHRENIVEQSRFWLAMIPIGQAILSSLSGAPGILLLGNYLELLLVPIAVITSYWFARVLGLSSRAAGYSVLLQVLLYLLMFNESWPVGFWFYINMSEDKVLATFLLAPVFFAFALKFIQRPTKINLLAVFLSGTGLVLAHPVILFFSCAIASGLGFFAWVTKKTHWRKVIQLLLVFVCLMMPYLIIRLYDQPSQSQIPYDAESASESYQIERYTHVVNDIFYGLNPEVLKFINISPDNPLYGSFQFFRIIPIILALTAGILAFVRLKQGPLYWYILSCVLLVIFATIPYTGWILGYFVSARLISRASWFSPLGLAGALVLMAATGPLRNRRLPADQAHQDRGRKVNQALAGVSVSLILIGALFAGIVIPRTPQYFSVLDHYRQLAQIGAYVDQSTFAPTTVIALNYGETQMLPGVSANANLISFREEKPFNPHNYFMTLDKIQERIDASNAIRSLDQTVLAEERCALIAKYDVRFVLARRDNADLYKNIINKCGIVVQRALETKDLVLLELK